MTITLALCWAASQATGLTLRQEVVFVSRAGDLPANVQRLGEVFANGDGAYTLVVRTGIDLKAATDALAASSTRIVALPPRLVGKAERFDAVEAGRALHRRALRAYLALPAERRTRSRDDKALRARGLTSQATYLEWMESRTYPGRAFDYAAVALAYQAKRRMHTAYPESPWVNIGPNNLAVATQYGFGAAPVNGRINDIAFDSANPSRIFAASARGGVWRSTDGGATWTPLSDSWSRIETSVVKTNPGLANRVYVGTGDAPKEFGDSIGVMVSTDNGDTWTARGTTIFAGRRINDILVSTNNASTLIVAADGGTQLYRTTDEGVNWTVAVDNKLRWTDLDATVVTNGVRHFWAAGSKGTDMFLYRSVDNGQTWGQVTAPAPGVSGDRILIACSKRNANVVYVMYTTSRRVWKNTGPNNAWVEITGDLGVVSDDVWGQGDYNIGMNCFLRTSQAGTNDTLILQNIDSYVSESVDGAGYAAGTWKSLTGAYTGGDLIHVDHHAATQNNLNPTLWLFATDGGVARANYNPFTNTFAFTPLSTNLCAALVTRIAVDQTVQDGVLAGMQDNGMGFCAIDTGNWLNLEGGDLGHCLIAPIPSRQYIMPPNFAQANLDPDPNEPLPDPGHVIATNDGWLTRFKASVYTAGEKRRNSPPMALSASGNSLYVGTDVVHRYSVTTNTWTTKLGGVVLSPSGHIRHLAVAPSDSRRLYAVTSHGEAWTSGDSGATWSEIFTGSPGLPNESFGHISVHPTIPTSVLVTIESAGNTAKLWECQNVAGSPRVWSARNGTLQNQQLPNAAANAVARHPQNPTKSWFVATDNGVYVTMDGGKTWADLTPVGQFPNVPVTDIKTQASNKLLYVSTYGRGVWRRSIPKFLGLSP